MHLLSLSTVKFKEIKDSPSACLPLSLPRLTGYKNPTQKVDTAKVEFHIL